jgi:hypothetical protein
MGRPCFHGPELVSLPEALDTAHAILSQVRHVLRREWEVLGVVKQCLKEWSSLLMVQTKSEYQKAADKRAHLDVMEKVLKEEQVAISKLDQSTEDLLEKAEETHVEADQCVNTCTRL